MPDLRDLYQEVILDHSKHPRNFGIPLGADHRAEGHNPVCGDRLTVHVKLRDDRIEDLGFQGSGCAISMASASMMTEALRGATIEQSRKAFQTFQDLVTGKHEPAHVPAATLGKLVVFSGVREFPVRVKCATLAWHTLRAALASQPDPVSTE